MDADKAAQEYIAGRYPDETPEFKERIRQAFITCASWLRDKSKGGGAATPEPSKGYCVGEIPPEFR